MTNYRVLLLAICLLFALGAATQDQDPGQMGDAQNSQQQATRNDDQSLAQRQVQQASERLRQAILNRDADSLRQIFAINYTGVDPLGRRLDRTRAVNVIAHDLTKIETMKLDSQSIDAGTDTAVETGSAYMRGNLGGEAFSTAYRFIRQWQRQDGQWKLVSTRILGATGGF